MICKSCGAEISDTIIKCPYCDTENELIAEQEQIAEENSYKEKMIEFAERPERAKNSTQSFFRKHYLKFIIAVIALILISVVVSIIAPKIKYRKVQKNLKTLEEFYQVNDFEAMGDYLHEIPDSHKTYYNKYYDFYRLYDRLQLVEDFLPVTLEHVTMVPEDKESLLTEFHMLFSLMAEYQNYEDLGYLNGEEHQVNFLKERTISILKEDLKLNDEEIHEGTDIALYIFENNQEFINDEEKEQEYLDLLNQYLDRILIEK